MKFKLKTIVAAQESLGKLVQMDLPIKTSYRLGKIVSKLNSELKLFNEKRDELIKKYGKADDDGNVGIKPSDKEAIKKFESDINEILDIETDLEFYPLTLEELKGVKISAVDMANLGDFINE